MRHSRSVEARRRSGLRGRAMSHVRWETVVEDYKKASTYTLLVGLLYKELLRLVHPCLAW